MSDPLAPVLAGEPIVFRASTWNAVLDAARAYRQAERPDRKAERSRPGCLEALGFNDTGAALPAFKPAKVTGTGPYTLHSASEGVAFDWSGRPVVTLDVPAATTDMVAVTLEAIPDGAFGRVAVAGWCACDVDIGNAGHGYASPTTDTDALVSGATGSVRILATGTGTARRTAVYLGDQVGGGVCGSPLVFRVQVGSSLSLTKTTDVADGITVLTDVTATLKQRFRDVTVDANGCIAVSDPYCVTAGDTCTDGETDGPDYWCIDGVCHKVYDGIEPDGGSGPYATPAECSTLCADTLYQDCDTLGYSFPGNVTLSGANPTGCFSSFSDASDAVTDLSGSPAFKCGYGYGTVTGRELSLPTGCYGGSQFLASWAFQVYADETAGVANGDTVQSFSMNKVPALPNAYFWEFVGANGFSSTSPSNISAGLASRVISGTDGTLTAPLHIGTVKWYDAGMVLIGSFDAYVQ